MRGCSSIMPSESMLPRLSFQSHESPLAQCPEVARDNFGVGPSIVLNAGAGSIVKVEETIGKEEGPGEGTATLSGTGTTESGREEFGFNCSSSLSLESGDDRSENIDVEVSAERLSDVRLNVRSNFDMVDFHP